jgi:hypothetical protein
LGYVPNRSKNARRENMRKYHVELHGWTGSAARSGGLVGDTAGGQITPAPDSEPPANMGGMSNVEKEGVVVGAMLVAS